MCFALLHYTSKNEKKGHECFQRKKKHSKLPIEKKKDFKRCMQQKKQEI